MEKLTMQEEEAMRWIWRIGPCFVKDVLAKYEDPKPPYTTLASVIKNLERKKYVKAKRYGNTYEYRPLIEETEYKRTFLGGVVRIISLTRIKKWFLSLRKIRKSLRMI